MAENAPVAPPKYLLDGLAASLSDDLEPNDPILACGDAVLAALEETPNQVIRLAHEKLHSFPFHDVPVCWRRLFEEASLHIALRRMEGIPADRDKYYNPSSRPPQEDWISDVVQTLDKAAVMSGLPRREELVQGVFDSLETMLYGSLGRDNGIVEEPCPKRRKIDRGPIRSDEDVKRFATNLAYDPHIQYPISTHINPSFDQFQKHLLANNGSPTPLIIQDALQHWPALSHSSRSWSNPSYLLRKTLGGRRLVPVEFGRSYTDAGWGQRIITFGEFMTVCLLQKSNVSSKSPVPGEVCTQRPQKGTVSPSDRTEDLAIDNEAPTRGVNLTGYLAQHDLFSQIRSLRSDISIPDYCYCTTTTASSASESPPPTEEPFINAWLGPSGTISPLHTDPHHNIFCQVVGSKYIRLYAPCQTFLLYPHGIDEQGVDMSNTSQVDIELFKSKNGGQPPDIYVSEETKLLHEKFPLFKKAQYSEGLLGPGDCLYIPKGWWHYVESLSTSFSVSFWWD